jgi:uncharacterized surface protein with fasciclin (FAS1) repeats
VFAPTNAAFAKVPKADLAKLLDPANVAQLVKVLKYHVVSGAVYSKDLKPTQEVKPLEGQDLTIEASAAGVTINGKAKVIAADNAATNGVVHIIDTVLMPKTMAPPTPSKDIVELAQGSAGLSTLVTALKAGNLVTALQGKGPFTVFAPSNAAFAKLPQAALERLLDPENVDELVGILTYHVLSGSSVYSKDLKASQQVATMQGQELLVEFPSRGRIMADFTGAIRVGIPLWCVSLCLRRKECMSVSAWNMMDVVAAVHSDFAVRSVQFVA